MVVKAWKTEDNMVPIFVNGKENGSAEATASFSDEVMRVAKAYKVKNFNVFTTKKGKSAKAIKVDSDNAPTNFEGLVKVEIKQFDEPRSL